MAIRLTAEILNMARHLRRKTRVLPPTLCLICRQSLRRGYSLCRDCEAELPWLGDTCGRCGEELTEPGTDICSRCRLDPPEFDSCYAPFAYRSPVDKLIVSYKFSADLASGYALSRILARIMAQRWRNGRRPDVLLPVPLHVSRLRQRGFNQALEIAKVVSAESGVPLRARGLRKSRPTPPQTEMRNARERGANIRSSFELGRYDTIGKARRIALVDDVVTTMSTVAELARMLKQAGAEQVEVCCLARAE